MDQNHFEMLLEKAKEHTLTSTEKLELMRELNIGLEQYNELLEKALREIPEEN
jgi:adenylate kinase